MQTSLSDLHDFASQSGACYTTDLSGYLEIDCRKAVKLYDKFHSVTKKPILSMSCNKTTFHDLLQADPIQLGPV